MIITVLPFLYAWIAGLAIGIVLGCMPGLGVLAGVMLAYPFLLDMMPMQVILFYLALIIASQFTGSIVATFFGVPGETSSIVASKIGYRWNQRGRSREAISVAGTGSLFASLGAVLTVSGIAQWIYGQSWIYSSKINGLIMLVVLCYLIFVNHHRWINACLIITGLFLGNIGANGVQSLSMTFGQSWLQSGLENMIFMCMTFIIPTLISSSAQMMGPPKAHRHSLVRDIALLIKYRWAWIRGTMVGAMAGLIPAIGTSVSSNIAYVVEKQISPRSMNHLISAESSNNSAVLSSLLPLIVLGLPILASESLILEAMTAREAGIGLDWFLAMQHGLSRLHWLALFAVLTSVLMYIVATRGAIRLAGIVSMIPMSVTKVVIPCFLLAWAFYGSVIDNTVPSAVFTVLISLPFTYLAVKHKIDTLPLIFSFLLAPFFVQSGYAVFNLINF